MLEALSQEMLKVQCYKKIQILMPKESVASIASIPDISQQNGHTMICKVEDVLCVKNVAL